MKAIILEQPGPPEALRLVDVPTPQAAPGQVLVKAHYIGVGVPDLMVRSGRYMWMPTLPAIPGIELSGEIVEVGSQVEGFAPGDRVIVSARERSERCGCYAEYIAARPVEMFGVPAGVDLRHAAALANYQVAWHMLHTASRVRRGEVVLVLAAAGGVGSAVLDLARLAGLETIAVVSSAARERHVRELGAFAVINRQREDIAARVIDVTGGRGADLILDPVGGPQIGEQLQMLAPFGTLLSYGGLVGPPSGDLLGSMRKWFDSSPAVRRFTMHTLDRRPEQRRAATLALLDHLAAGEITPRIHGVLPLAEAAEAHRLMEAGAVTGKLLLSPA